MIKWLDLSPLAAKKGKEGVHFVRCMRLVNRKRYILCFKSLADDCNKIRFIVDCHYTSRSQRNIFKLT